MFKNIDSDVRNILNSANFENEEIHYNQLELEISNLKLMEIFEFKAETELEQNKVFKGDYKSICENVASLIYHYQVRENCMMKLIHKGVIYPVGEVRDYYESMYKWSFTYEIDEGNVKTTCNTSISFPIIPFSKFKLLRMKD